MSQVALARNGYLYGFGGEVGGPLGENAITSTVWYAAINATGSLGSWSLTTALPNKLWKHSAVYYNGYVYILGGSNIEPVFKAFMASWE